VTMNIHTSHKKAAIRMIWISCIRKIQTTAAIIGLCLLSTVGASRLVITTDTPCTLDVDPLRLTDVVLISHGIFLGTMTMVVVHTGMETGTFQGVEGDGIDGGDRAPLRYLPLMLVKC